MEAASAPSSKVTVQCTDLSNVLEDFQGKFAARGPLRSLHWKSPSRPLRSIPSLSVDLVQDERALNALQTNVRRHQIPGLRQTPYVKLYLLRCDDKETYKETGRKDIKLWIKDNTLEKESKSSLRNQEHHDAFEWMIVHVVLPNTPAASQPKSSKHISLETTNSTDSVNSKSKWTGKSSSTIYDKLRADFSSSKSTVPRVAQVRITEPAKPSGSLSAADIEEQWTEFVDGLKECILKSFSTRVAQYEEDIREREAQRSLPGWNFCTFFILKEGLARGFESIGLLEDALGVYDELEVGLDLLVSDSVLQDEADAPGGLLPYSRDLKAKLRQALEEEEGNTLGACIQQEPETPQVDVLASPPQSKPFDLQRQQYRDLILTNQVSALDLRIYIFARRWELLLASANTIRSTKPMKVVKDASVLADLTERSIEAITSASRQLRADITLAYGGRLSGKDRTLQAIIVGNMVASWTWSAIMQIIAIAMPVLEIYDSKPSFANTAKGSEEHDHDTDASHHLSERNPSSTPSSPQRESFPSSKQEALPNSLPAVSHAMNNSQDRLPRGVDQLAAWTARLILLARAVVEELQACQPWTDELRSLEVSGFHASERKIYRFSTVHDTQYGAVSASNEISQPGRDSLRSLTPPTLTFAASSKANFHTVFRALSRNAYRLLNLADSLRGAQQVLLDIASLAFYSQDFDVAAQSLRKLVELQQQDETLQMQPYALALYAQCLKSLNRPEEYIHCLLKCLQCPSLSMSTFNAHNYVEELLQLAAQTTTSEIPLSILAEVCGIDRCTSELEGQGGFCVSLRLKSTTAASFTVTLPLRLVLTAVEKQEPSKILLKSFGNVEISPATSVVVFRSTVVTSGWFDLHNLEMNVGKLSFAWTLPNSTTGKSSENMSLSHPETRYPSLFVYPQPNSPSLELLPSRVIILGEVRKVDLTIRCANDEMSSCILKLRAATAGLRIRVHDAYTPVNASKLETTRVNNTTLLRLATISQHQALSIEIPYTLENPLEVSISIKCELSYEMNGLEYTLYESCAADVLLPVSVNVQDIHRPNYWFSRFHIGPSTLVPIVVLECATEDDPDLAVEESSVFDQALIVFPHQPANWTIQLKRLKNEKSVTPYKISLVVRYKCFDEIILNSLKAAFAKDLDMAGFSGLSRPLISHLAQTIKAGWTEQDLESAALTREVEMWHIGDLDWSSLLSGIDRSTKAKLELWLTKWHRTRSSVLLDFSKAGVRSLKLAVELPPRPPVVATSLTVLQGISGTNAATLGQPLVCELLVEKFMPFESTDAEMEFTFELFAHADAWLVGGRRKGNLYEDQKSVHCQVVLFPQRVGATLLPVIDVRCRQRQQATDEAVWRDMSVEIYNRTVSKTVNVSPNLTSTTVGIGSDDGVQTEAGTLLVTRPREEG